MSETAGYEHVPSDMKALSQWVCYRIEPAMGGGKPTKIPYDPVTGWKAKSNDAQTWRTFPEALAAQKAGMFDGLGFELENGVFGIDLDHVIGEDCVLSPDALEIVEQMDSYTEFSPSGTGLHILAKGTIPPGDRKREWVEMYDTKRFFTVTGESFGSARPLAERTVQADEIHRKWIARPARIKREAAVHNPARNRPQREDAELLRLGERMYKGKFVKLWNGDTSAYNGDDSAADMALCNMLGQTSYTIPIRLCINECVMPSLCTCRYGW